MGEPQQFPQNWTIKDFDPNEHMMQLKNRDYLNVQNRLLWFIRDQRALIVAGLAKVPYVVQSELVEMDRSTGWAHFRTTVRDVLGNEATMYGSETAKDFGDYAEKAGTKSLGRALLALGYGTAMAAAEFDDRDTPADTPMARRAQQQQQQQQQTQGHHQPQAQPQAQRQHAAAAPTVEDWEPSADGRFCERVRALGITTKGHLDAFLAESATITDGQTRKQRAYLLLARKESQASANDRANERAAASGATAATRQPEQPHDLRTLATGGVRP